MLHWLRKAARAGILECLYLDRDIRSVSHTERLLYSNSVKKKEKKWYALLKFDENDMLGVFGERAGAAAFEGKEVRFQRGEGTGERRKDFRLCVRFCPLSHENAAFLREVFTFTSPSSLYGTAATFGAGDRLGIASSGIIRAARHYRVSPVLAQQSVRELALTGRNFVQVLDDATWAVFREGYERPWGADGDHLKNDDEVTRAITAGYTMITADVSESINEHFLHEQTRNLQVAFAGLDFDYRNAVKKQYARDEIILGNGERVGFTQEELLRVVLAYRDAAGHAVRLHKAAENASQNKKFDFELSIDETSAPTSVIAHHFIAQELRRNGIMPISVAPHFAGEFQKGIDYIGDEMEFENSLRLHAAVAREFGYKLSVHSGSDKFRVFPIIGRVTGGRFHIKTSGTHWLEALGIVARRAPSFFRTVAESAIRGFENARVHYHVSVTESVLDSLDGIPDARLADVLSDPCARQVLHITYGEIMQDKNMRKQLYSILRTYREDYWKALVTHVEKHLDSLGVPHLAD